MAIFFDYIDVYTVTLVKPLNSNHKIFKKICYLLKKLEKDDKIENSDYVNKKGENMKINIYIEKIIIVTGFIFSIILFLPINSHAEIIKDNKDGIEIKEYQSVIDAVTISSDVIKQAINNVNEDKPYTDEYIKWLNSSQKLI